MVNLNPGDKCLLDGKKEVVIVKPHNRQLTKYVVEIPGKSVEKVERHRLSAENQSQANSIQKIL